MKKLCSINGCNSDLYQSKYCSKHYKRWYRYGDPLRERPTVIERFFDKIELIPFSSCWYWMGHLDKDGYGSMKIKKKVVRAHRYSYAVHNGPILDGRIIMHSCDNPSCVNPSHLSAGTNAENSRDMVKKGRTNAPYGESAHNSKLKNTDVIKIKELSVALSQSKIARIFCIDQSSVSRIISGKRWGRA